MERIRIRVTGIVQGVGYRWFVRRVATDLGLAGWVRNLHDGSVEAEAQGGEGPVRAFVAELRVGPPAADVRGIDVERIPPVGMENGFRVRF
ncbi:MAG: acylphosphatase [Candidatus Krumholzibacteriota bacterium]|nr:acylphosphatase [Candidatus Krumholzibacteriota bacterium]